jgi:hypothetical protein
MNIYRITVREISSIEYEIEADTEDEARTLIGTGDQRVVDSAIVDWNIIEIEERES